AANRILPRHLRAEEAVEQRPHLGRLERRAAFLAFESTGKACIFHPEQHAMCFVDPLREGYDHMHQHLVAIGDDERAGHGSSPFKSSSRRAALASASGLISSAAAQATRSGSCA